MLLIVPASSIQAQDKTKDGTQQLLPHSKRSLEADTTNKKTGENNIEDPYLDDIEDLPKNKR